MGELIGVITSAAFVCLTVVALNNAYGFGTEELPAPQATLMKVVIDGVLESSLPWGLVGIGVGIAVLAELARINSLAFAVGVYLPVSTMVPVFLGGALRWLLQRSAADAPEEESRREQGILFGSGLVGGEGLLGVGIAMAAGYAASKGVEPWSIGVLWSGALGPWLSLAVFLALVAYFWRIASARLSN